MAQTYPAHIWHNGRIKPWAEATVHVMAHALHYGSSVFEGIRSYATPNGPAIFRLQDHIVRLFNSAKIYDIAMPYSIDEIKAACSEAINANGLGAAYVRPIVYRGLGGFGLSADTPTDVAVAAWPMGAYLGAGVLEQGIDACVSSWQRFAPNTIPAGAKAGQKMRLKGRGLPGTPSGDQYVVLKIVLPPNDSPQAQALYEQMKRELNFDPRAELEQVR